MNATSLTLCLALAVVAATPFAPRQETAAPDSSRDDDAGPRRSGSLAAADYVATPLRGFDVRVEPSLLAKGDEAELGARALDALDRDLGDVLDQTPPTAHAFLRSVPIFLGVADPVALCACYHPSATWLERNGFDPAKARAVEIANARTFVDWRRRQPSMVLHELAHAYLDQVVRDEKPRLEEALARTRERGVYDRTLRWAGQIDRHYALTNIDEYFAETTEALLGVNDFYPFVRAELLVADPEGAALVEELWGAALPGTGEADLVELATREVESLHAFLDGWISGRAEKNDEVFARFADALAPDFRIVGIDGRPKDRDVVLADLRARHGIAPDGTVRAEVMSVRRIDAEHVLVVYGELQTLGDGPKRLIASTALLARDPDAPGGVAWLHLHESLRGGPR